MTGNPLRLDTEALATVFGVIVIVHTTIITLDRSGKPRRSNGDLLRRRMTSVILFSGHTRPLAVDQARTRRS